MIGFFDSGLGGLTVLREVVRLLPQYSCVYLGDNGRAPYGDRDPETIYKFTTEGIAELMRRGSELVILACNTSSARALRRIQQKWLPAHFPEKNVLGVIVPAAEEIGKITHSREIGVLATRATVDSRAYAKEVRKIWPDIHVYEEACPLLVPLIEEGDIHSQEIDDYIQIHLDELLLQSSRIDALILGCTHYAVIENQIRKHLPTDITLISQGPIIARKLKEYLVRHPEIERRLEKDGSTSLTTSGLTGSPQAGERVFLSTGKSKKIESLAGLFYGSPVKIEPVKLRAVVYR